MTLQEIADALVAHCKAGREAEALTQLYAPNAVSVEATAFDGGDRETAGIDGIRGKHAWWDANFEVHGGAVDGPFLHGPDRFAVIFEIDATHKASGSRNPMKEVALYTVADAKIVREEFFYTG
ncbi:MAG: nuclear transport factor 2 family protein [Pseudomonadota bacterium]